MNETFQWIGNDLIDPDGQVVANVRSDVIQVGQERLLLESSKGSSLGFRARATCIDGTVYTLQKTALTVHELSANCAGRVYRLMRTSPWRKIRKISDSTGQAVVRVEVRTDGTVVATTLGEIPELDFVFLTYGCTLVDAPTRNIRFA